jgi:hypothetical protein
MGDDLGPGEWVRCSSSEFMDATHRGEPTRDVRVGAPLDTGSQRWFERFVAAAPEPTEQPKPHDWRWGNLDRFADKPGRAPVAICTACEAVAWNEVDFADIDAKACPGLTAYQQLRSVQHDVRLALEMLEGVRRAIDRHLE